MSASIELVRSGGFAGLSRRWALELSEDEAAAIARLIDDAAAAPADAGRGADRFQYDLTLTHGGRTRTLTLREGAIPADLRPVLDRLTRSGEP